MIRWAISYVVDQVILLTIVYWVVRSVAGSQFQSVDLIQQWIEQASPFAEISRALDVRAGG